MTARDEPDGTILVQNPVMSQDNENSMNSRIYGRLDRLEVRILVLHSGRRGTPVSCSLEIAQLSDGSSHSTYQEPTQYEALSWHWGIPDPSCDPTIILCGHTHQIPLNLEIALQYLRYSDKDRFLWCDAVCINQEDVLEKAYQIKLMRWIYTQAKRVIVWLGEADTFGEIYSAMLQIDALAQLFQERPWKFRRDKTSFHPNESQYTDEIADQVRHVVRDIQQLATFFGRPWFGRRWVIQEVCLAPSGTLVVCGDRSIAFESLFALCDLYKLYHHGGLSDDFWIETLGKPRYILSIIKSFRSGKPVPFLDKMWYLYDCECMLPQDRYIALFGIEARDTDLFSQLTRSPRKLYTWPVWYLYTLSAAATIQATQKLDVLNYCTAYSNSDHMSDLPSWAPDWSLPRSQRPYLTGFYAMDEPEDGPRQTESDALNVYSNSRHNYLIPTKRGVGDELHDQEISLSWSYERAILTLRGFHISTVKHIGGFQSNEVVQLGDTPRALEGDQVGELWEMIQDSNSPTYSAVRSFMANIYGLKDVSKELLKSSIKAQGADWGLNENDSAAVATSCERFLARTDHWGDKRSLFVAENGQVGLGPRSMEVGDVVMFLVGGYAQFMLRPLVNGRYMLLEECLLGYRFLWKYELGEAIEQGKAEPVEISIQ